MRWFLHGRELTQTVPFADTERQLPRKSHLPRCSVAVARSWLEASTLPHGLERPVWRNSTSSFIEAADGARPQRERCQLTLDPLGTLELGTPSVSNVALSDPSRHGSLRQEPAISCRWRQAAFGRAEVHHGPSGDPGDQEGSAPLGQPTRTQPQAPAREIAPHAAGSRSPAAVGGV